MIDAHKNKRVSYDHVNTPNRICKGKCVNYKAKKPKHGGRYASGQVRCQTCEIYLAPKGVNYNRFCKCCNYRIRTKPRNSLRKEEYNKKVVGVQELKIKQESDDEDWWSDESTKKLIKQNPNNDKKSTPIYEETDESVKTYYEFKEFLYSGVELVNNYQLVMLKGLLERSELHKGEIAESLAYFNNKDSSDINRVKCYFGVPTYDALLKQGFITVDNKDSKIPSYSLNINLGDFQKTELIYYLTDKITIYNKEHNIPENEYPNANNIGCIDWSCSDIKNASNVQKIKNFVKSSNSLWIWPVTPENWEIVKSKNIWG